MLSLKRNLISLRELVKYGYTFKRNGTKLKIKRGSMSYFRGDDELNILV